MKNIILEYHPPKLSWKILAASATILACLSSLSFAADDDGSQITLTDLTKNGPTIATEFTGNKLDHKALANFAWREFIALNSPAGDLPVMRGKPDSNRNFVASGKADFYSSGKSKGELGTNLLVWETFAHRTELFPHYSSPPTQALPFAKKPSYVFAPVENGSTPTFGNGVLKLYNNLDESSQIGQNIIFFPKSPPNRSRNPFDDSQLLFEAKVNETEYDYGQTNPGFPVDLNPNSIEVKAAWRRIIPGVDASRYHTAEAVYYTGSEEAPIAHNGTFGLVGLHIIQKTPNYPTFIFATFEHNDALTLPNGSSTGLYYITDYTSLGYDPAAGDSPVAVINNGSGIVSTPLPYADSSLPVGVGVPPAHAGPISVKQPATITSDVTSVNNSVHALMTQSPLFKDSVWKNYSLKGVQAIPTNEQIAGATANAETLDYYLANIVIESSQPGVQLFKGGVIGPGDSSDVLTATDFINNRETDSIPFPSSKPSGMPYCGDFEKGINWESIQNKTITNQTVAIPRGYPKSSYQPKLGVDGALFAGPYQWGGDRCGGTCTNNDGNSPICYITANASNVTLSDNSKVNMGGCMGCHGQAQQAGVDFSFLFFSKGGAGFSADTVGEATTEAIHKRAQNYLKVNQ